MSNINEFLDHDDPIVRAIANDVNMLITDRKAGRITEAQAKELLEDLTQIDQIDDLANSLERKSMVTEAINKLTTAASFIL